MFAGLREAFRARAVRTVALGGINLPLKSDKRPL
jgi:hypothetical protein